MPYRNTSPDKQITKIGQELQGNAGGETRSAFYGWMIAKASGKSRNKYICIKYLL